MRRLMPVAAAIVLAFCAYAIQSVQMPGRVFACSCAMPPSLAQIAADPDRVLAVATIGQSFGDDFDARTALTIERAFTGQIAAQVVVSGIGSQQAGCQVGAKPGDRWIFAISRAPEGTLHVSACGLGERIGTATGNALLAEAIGLFGEGQPPPSADPEAAPLDLEPWLGGSVWLVGLVLVSAAVFGAVILIASRRRPS
jgi:hypothetical protein